ncbi:Histone deacetylase 8 [Hypsizygus marmoreus]|uniref:Histone deacetylase 8 n=1 Tax=Hypsizygus marmoreus TaxID=39966 RepID=A0A369JBT8_HYPMA|nr:Histone deacetylase 8 [Hypsizygus marmoreus]
MALSMASITSHELAKNSLVDPIEQTPLLGPLASSVHPEKASYKEMAVYHALECLDLVLNPTGGVGEDGGKTTEVGLEDKIGLSDISGLARVCPVRAGCVVDGCQGLVRARQILSFLGMVGDTIHRNSKQPRSATSQTVSSRSWHSNVLCYIYTRHRILCTPRKPRIMYIDLDLHFLDGVLQAFHMASRPGESRILTMSIHPAAPGFFPVSPLSGLSSSPPNMLTPSTHTHSTSPYTPMGSPLPLGTPIPDHAGFSLYEPSFTLDVPAGNAGWELGPVTM